MKRLLIVAILFALLPLCSFGQSTTLSGTVTDAGAQTWNNGTFNFQFIPNPAYPAGPYTWTGGTLPKNIAGTLSAGGAYSVSIPSTSAISPGGSTWQGIFCPQATSPCYTANPIIVLGATQTFNVTPPAIAISLINPPPSPMLAYSDAEIASAVVASFYYNIGTQGYRYCQAITTAQFCTTWSNIGSGGGGSSFTAITSGTNTIANMICGTGCSMSTSGSGTIAATTATTATNVAFSGVTPGTNTGALVIGAGGSITTTGGGTITATSVPFSGVTTGTNTAPLTVGTGGSLTFTGTGTINATAINGVTVLGVPTAGQTPVASSGTQAVWGNLAALNQRWLNNGTTLPGEPNSNAVPPLTATDNPVNSRIDIGVNVCTAGALHSGGVLADPGVSPNLNQFVRSDCTLAVPSTGVAATANPLTASNLSNTATPWIVNVDVANCGPNPYVDIRCFGARAIFTSSDQLANGGITASITAGSNIALVTSSTIQTGDWVDIVGAGAAQSMSTPAAPTVAAAVSFGPTGTGNGLATSTGATTYSYKLVAVDVNHGYTAASAATTITNGQANLGAQNIAFSSGSLTLNAATWTTAARSPEVFVVGEMIQINGSFVNITSIPNNTSIVTTWAGDTRNNGAVSNLGSGTIYYWNSVNVIYPTRPAGVWKYAIYKQIAGIYTLVGISTPSVPGNNSDGNYGAFEDYGSTMSGSPTLPIYLPTTAPSAASNDDLIAQVTAGGGSTTLTLSASAGSGAGFCGTGTCSTATIVLDNTPALKAAKTAATFPGAGGMVYIPSVAFGQAFPFQSYADLSTGQNIAISQSGPIYLNDTINIGNNIYRGDTTTGTVFTDSFSFTKGVGIQIGHAYPGFQSNAAVNLSGVQFINPANSYISLLINGAGALPTGIVQNVGFGNPVSTDYMGIPIYVVATPASGSAGLRFEKFSISTGPNQVTGATATPLMVISGFGEVTLSDFMLNRRGIFEKAGATSGVALEATMNFERQGGITPMFTFMPSVNGGGFTAKLHNMIQDTEAVALVSHLTGAFGVADNAILYLDTFGNVSGFPFAHIYAPTANTTGAGAITQNTRTLSLQTGGAIDGVFNTTVNQANTSKQQANELMTISPAYSYFADAVTAPAPVLTAVAGTGMNPGNYTVTVAPDFFNGYGLAEGTPSLPSNTVTLPGTCPSVGNCQILVNWQPVPVATNYDVFLNGFFVSNTLGQFTGTSFQTNTSTTSGATLPPLTGGGPSGFNTVAMWAPQLILGPVVAPTGVVNTTTVYEDSTSDWLSFKPNGNTAYAVPGITGPVTVGHSACWTGVGFAMIDCPGGGGGGGSGTVNPAQQWSIGTYVNSGSATVIGGIPGPTGPNNVLQVLTSTPTSGIANQGTFTLLGLPGRSNGSATDAVVGTDRNSWIFETFGGAQAVSIAQSIYGNGFAFKMGVRGLNAVMTLTPNAGTCNGASTCTMLQGQNATLASIDASNLQADIHDPPIVCSTGLSCTRGDYSLTISAPGAGNMATNTANVMTSSGTLNGAAMSTTAGLIVPSGAGAIPINDGVLAENTTNHTLVYGFNGTTTLVSAAAATGTGTATTCTNQVITAVSGIAAPTCATITNGMLTAGTSVNGVGITLGSNSDLASGTGTVHGLWLFEGASTHPNTMVALTANQIPVGVASADPVAGNLSELSATLYAADTGAVNVLVACSTPAAAAIRAGQIIEVKPNHANTTGNPTLNWCGQGAATITSFATTLANSDLVTTVNALFLYDGTNMELLNPQTNKVSTPPTWNNVLSATGNATFNNAGFTTTFNQTSNVLWLWANTTAATVTTPQAAPSFNWNSQYWGGAGSNQTETWKIAPVLTAGLNGNSALAFTYTGSTGEDYVDLSTTNFKMPRASGFTADANMSLGFDTALVNVHIFNASGDHVVASFGGAITDSDSLYVSAPGGSSMLLKDAGYAYTTVVRSAASLTNTAFMTGSGVQGSQTPNTSSTLDSSGNATFAGTLTCNAATCLGSDTATTQAAKDNSTKVATTAYVDRATGLTTGTSVTLTAPRQYFVCTGTCTVTVPVPAAGYEFCVMNDDNIATVITLAAIGSSARYENTARTAYGTAGTGTFVSGGAAADKVCIVGRDATHYLTTSFNGTWTAN